MRYISLDEIGALEAAQNDPEGFIQNLSSQPVVLDEFQYAPELVRSIKLASDLLPPDQRGRFFLTGSTDIFKSAQTEEALPGHMARVELYPLSVTEKEGGNFNLIDFLLAEKLSLPDELPLIERDRLAQVLIDGGYPELQDKGSRARQMWFQSYLQGRIFKDFESIYSPKGDYHTKVVKSYIEALEWMFIIKRIHPYIKKRAKRQTIGMAKLHMVDTGLACYLLGLKKKQQLSRSALFGGLLESFVVMECCKHMAWSSETMNIYHFRDKRKNVVDIVLEQDDNRLIGIEVKASATIRQRDFKGLKTFADLTGDQFKFGLVLYTGSRFLPFYDGSKPFFAVPLSVLWL